MLLRASLALALAAPQEPAVTAPASASPVRVDVELAVDAATRTVAGTMEVVGHVGPLELSLPDRYAFTTLEPRLTRDLEGSRAGAAVELERAGPFLWRAPAGEGPLRVRWTAALDHRQQPDVVATNDAYEHPFLAEDHGMLFTGALVPTPRLAAAEVRVRVSAGPADAPWPVIAPWPRGADGTYTPRLRDLADDIVLVGGWRTESVDAGGLTATFALAPSAEGLAPLVERQLAPIVEHEVALFGGPPQPAYLFVFGPADGLHGYGGSPKTNAMTLFVGAGLPPEVVEQGLSHLVAHEFHHTWMRARCQPEDALRFVAEGFTDYFAWRTSWSLGHMSDAAYLAELEDQLSRGRRALSGSGRSLAACGGPEFFLGREAYDACYAAGLTLALWTDLALRRAEPATDLAELLRAFYGDPRWDDGTRPNLDHWCALLERRLGEDLSSLQRVAVTSPEGFDPVALFAAIDVEVRRDARSAGDSPRANFDGATLRALDPAGPAALVGLRAGDRLVEVNGCPVADEAAVRRAWAAPLEGRLVVRFERDGEERHIDAPLPTVTAFQLPTALLDTLRK